MAETSWRTRGNRVAAASAAMLVFAVGTAAAERIRGTAGGDTVRGTPKADSLYGRGGDDRIFGLGGADVLFGGTGADRLWGGTGADRLVARDRTQDLVVCGAGRDVAIVDLLDLVHVSCELIRRPQSSAADTTPPEPTPVVQENAKAGTPGWAAFVDARLQAFVRAGLDDMSG